ncbi:MAG: sulfatase family protein [Planctomycetota bacterium]|jgi:arylsulfatase A-like enzyme
MMQRRRSWLTLRVGPARIALAAAAAVILRAPAGLADERPNFVLIFTDDQGYQDLGCFGSPDIRTPNLDRMAEEGMKFTDFYVAAPVCSASRAALLTGCYCARVSVTGVFFPRHRVGLNPEEITVAEVLKAKGYATCCIGKWHLGHVAPFLPTSQGFDSYFGVPYSNDMTIDPAMKLADDVRLRENMTAERIRSEKPTRNWVPLLRGEEVVEYPADQATLTKRYTEEATGFIQRNKDRPFFLYLPHTMPHIPLFASDAFRGKSKRGLYGDVIEEIDASVGEIMTTIRQLDLSERTLVIFTSDNGPWLSMGTAGGSALPLRDGKFTVYEGGMRVPFIAWWPGTVPAGATCRELAASIDVLPTLARLAGAQVPDDRAIDGKDISPLLKGESGAKSPHAAYYFRGKAVRSGHWKLHPAGRVKRGNETEEIPAQLYDLKSDVAESKNLAAEHPEVVDRLTKLLRAHNETIAANKRPAGKVE